MRIGIVGCGRVFDHYHNHLQEFSDIDISLIYDLNTDLSARYADFYEIARDLSDFCSPSIDLVCILTPSHTHYDLAKYFLGFSKHVLVEKPLSLRPSHAEELKSLACSNNVRIFCAFQNRFNDAIMAAYKSIKSGVIGKLVSCHVALHWCRLQEYYNDEWHGRWSLDGGVIAQQAIHHIDAAMYLTGLPDRVVGLGQNISNNLEAEDTFTGLLHNDSGLVTTLSATTSLRPNDRQASIIIQGVDGSINISGIALNKFQLVSNTHNENIAENFSNGYGLSHKKLLRAIESCLIKNLEPPHPGLDIDLAIYTTKVISSLYHSWENGRWSNVLEEHSRLWGA